jgi:hypothetical protein
METEGRGEMGKGEKWGKGDRENDGSLGVDVVKCLKVQSLKFKG